MKTMHWYKKALAVFAAICMMVVMLPTEAKASAEIVGSGQMGDNVYWTLDTDGVLTVSGTGATWDYKDAYTGHDWIWQFVGNEKVEIKSVKVTDGVTRLGGNLFAEMYELTDVELPESITDIGASTFQRCLELTNIKLPSHLEKIGSFAFKNCKFTEIQIPNSVNEIGGHAFSYCKNLITIYIPNGISIIRASTFWNCTSLESIGIPKSVVDIGEFAFAGCDSLTDVYYSGDETQWKKIRIDVSTFDWGNGNVDDNSALFTATIHYGVSGQQVEAKDEPSDWAKMEVASAISVGLVPENLQKNYTGLVSRGDVAYLFTNLLEKSSGKTIEQIMSEKGAHINVNAFSDTSDRAVLAANALGIINGVGGGKFDPEGTLTRAQIAAIINREARVLGVNTEGYRHSFTDVSGHWVNNELGWPTSAGIINGVGNNKFSPDTGLTIEQAIAITYRAFLALRK